MVLPCSCCEIESKSAQTASSIGSTERWAESAVGVLRCVSISSPSLRAESVVAWGSRAGVKSVARRACCRFGSHLIPVFSAIVRRDGTPIRLLNSSRDSCRVLVDWIDLEPDSEVAPARNPANTQGSHLPVHQAPRE